MQKLRFPFVIFCAFLLYFVLGTGWYDPAQLVIRGTAAGGSGSLKVSWDSGAGYNAYESRLFPLELRRADDQGNHSLVISSLVVNNSASLSKDVIISKIEVDGQVLDLLDIAKQKKLAWDGSSLRLSESNQVLNLSVKARESINIDMLTNNRSGIVLIGVDGEFRERDLYAANEVGTHISFDHWLLSDSGEFVVRMALPRYAIRNFLIQNDQKQNQLTVASITVETAETTEIVFSGAELPFGQTTLPGRSDLQKRYFNVLQFIQQLIFAFFSTWILLVLLRLFSTCGGFSGIFSGKRRLFWLFFLGAISIYSLWVFAFWPGVASIDSLKIWRAAVLPEVYLNDHPLLNIVLYKYLAHFWNNIGVVPVFHVLMTAVLVAYIFYSLSCRKISVAWLLPFYLLLIFSLPIGLYNTVLWKDIPFALIIVFWGYTLLNLYLQRVDGILRYSRERVVVLFLLLCAMALVRHNGAIYLIVVPIYFVFLRLLPMRFVFRALVGAGLLAVLCVILVKSGVIGDGGYFLAQGLGFLHNLLQRSLPTLFADAWNNYWGIFNVNQTSSAWDLWHYYLGDRFAYRFLLDTGWNDVFNYLPSKQAIVPFLTDIAMRLYHASYQVPFVYVAWNPLHFLMLYGIAIVTFRWLPCTAIFSSFILVQVLTLIVFVDVMNWRYYYFAFLGGYLLIPLMLLDIHRGKEKKSEKVRLQNAL